MKPIRLQIQILPWDEPILQPSSTPQARQDEVRPWTQPEAANNTLQQLVDNIVERYGRIYVGRGTLRVKELQDSWGSVLDLTDTVGDVFDDRSSNGDILTSICKVLRYPPDPSELHNPHRYTSLLPESSARPQKRPLALPAPLFQSAQRPLPGFENWNIDDQNATPGSANKRRKTHDVCPASHHARARMLPPTQLLDQGLLSSSQRTGTQGSEYQVEDSQRPLQIKIPNPYGTPNSLSFNRPHDVPHPNRTNETIPDSPTSRRSIALGVDREGTKSESPELRLSVHEVAPLDHAQNGTQGRDICQDEPVILEEHTDDRAHQPSPNPGDLKPRRSEQGPKQEATIMHVQTGRDRSGRSSFSPATQCRRRYNTSNGTRPCGSDVYDPIESDSEGFQGKQRMFSAKRLRLSKTPMPNLALPQASLDISGRNDPQFRDPGLPEKQQARPSGEQARPLPIFHVTPPCTFVQQLMRAAAEGRAQISAMPDSSPMVNSRAADFSTSQTVTGQKPTSYSGSSTSPKIHHQSLHSQTLHHRPLSDRQHHSFEIYTDPSEKILREGEKLITDAEQIADHGVRKQQHQDAKDLQYREAGPSTETAGILLDSEQGIDEAQHNSELAQAKPKVKAQLQAVTKGADEGGSDELKGPKHDGSDAKSDVEGEPPKSPHQMQCAILKAIERNLQPPEVTNTVNPNMKKLKEQELMEQAEKMMVAVDGAKQLELEKSKLKKSAPKQYVSKVTPAKDLKHTPRTPSQQAAYELREQQQAAALKFRQDRFGSVLSGDSSTKRSHDAGNETIGDSSGIKGSSQTPRPSPTTSESIPDRKRRTLTPILPGSASLSLKHGNGLRSTPLSTKSSSSMGAPLRSAMKQPASALRRSVSQVSFRSAQTSSPLGSKHGAKTVITCQGASSSTPGRRSSDTSAYKIPPAKIQSKLNVTRDKKMKGRADNLPKLDKQGTEGQYVVSSDDDEDSASSYTSEDSVGYGIAKAGPSSKEKLISDTTPTTSSCNSKSEDNSSSIDPALQALESCVNDMVSPTFARSSKSAPSSPAQAKSKARTPTQASEATSVTSGSPSEYEDDSENPEEKKSPQVKIQQRASHGIVAKPSTDSALASQACQRSSTRSGNTTNASGPIGADASKQLHRETQASVSAAQKKQLTKPHSDGLLPNGIKPASFRYPSLSQLKREAEGRFKRPSTLLSNATSQKEAPSVVDFNISSDSSDEDSESDSDSSGEPKLKRKSKSGFIPGMKGLLKIINGASIGKK
ncbi:MAG: hypothetical protein Q9217_002607 [Psora testacea]